MVQLFLWFEVGFCLFFYYFCLFVVSCIYAQILQTVVVLQIKNRLKQMMELMMRNMVKVIKNMVVLKVLEGMEEKFSGLFLQMSSEDSTLFIQQEKRSKQFVWGVLTLLSIQQGWMKRVMISIEKQMVSVFYIIFTVFEFRIQLVWQILVVFWVGSNFIMVRAYSLGLGVCGLEVSGFADGLRFRSRFFFSQV